MKRRIYSLAAAATTFVFCSCTTPWVTNTPRSAVEQYLLSATIERGVKCVDFGKFAGKKAFMDYDYFAPQVDKAYAQGVLEMQLSQAGIIITRKQEEADVIVQPLCGVLGTDYSKFFIGTPQLPIPVPNTDVSFAIPEIPIFSKYTRNAYGRFSFNIFNASCWTRLPKSIRARSTTTGSFCLYRSRHTICIWKTPAKPKPRLTFSNKIYGKDSGGRAEPDSARPLFSVLRSHPFSKYSMSKRCPALSGWRSGRSFTVT